MKNLIGMTEKEAKIELEKIGVNVIINYIKTFEHEHGEVIEQSIKNGKYIKKGDKVTLDVVQYKSNEFFIPSHYPLFRENTCIQESMLFSYLVAYYDFSDWKITINDIKFSFSIGEGKVDTLFVGDGSECQLSVGVWNIKANLRKNNWLIQEFIIGVFDNLNSHATSYSIQPFLPSSIRRDGDLIFYSFDFTDTSISREVSAIGYLTADESLNCYIYGEEFGASDNVSCSSSGNNNTKSSHNYFAKSLIGNKVIYTQGSKTKGSPWNVDYGIETLIEDLLIKQDSKYYYIIEKLRLLQSQ